MAKSYISALRDLLNMKEDLNEPSDNCKFMEMPKEDSLNFLNYF